MEGSVLKVNETITSDVHNIKSILTSRVFSLNIVILGIILNRLTSFFQIHIPFHSISFSNHSCRFLSTSLSLFYSQIIPVTLQRVLAAVIDASVDGGTESDGCTAVHRGIAVDGVSAVDRGTVVDLGSAESMEGNSVEGRSAVDRCTAVEDNWASVGGTVAVVLMLFEFVAFGSFPFLTVCDWFTTLNWNLILN